MENYMILNIYLYASITRFTQQSRWVFFPSPQTHKNTPIMAMLPKKGPLHVECSITINAIASVNESYLGGFFDNWQ